VQITRSNLFPQAAGNADFSGGKEHNFQTKFNFLTLTGDAAFQLDFFGKLRRATEASRAELLATEDARQTVILTLVSDVASDYFALLQLDLQLNHTRHSEDAARICEADKFPHGAWRGHEAGCLAGAAGAGFGECHCTDLERQIAQEENAISILLGNLSASCAARAGAVAQVLRRTCRRDAVVASGAAAGYPGGGAALWRRTRKSEWPRRIFPADFADGFRRGRFWKKQRVFRLMSSQLGIRSYGAQVSQPIFTGGALRGNLKLAKSQHQQALIAYRQAIQQAFGDVSDALIAYEKFHQVRVRQEETVADLQESVRLSIMRYRGGTTTYLEVLDGQRSLFSAELVLAQARGRSIRAWCSFIGR